MSLKSFNESPKALRIARIFAGTALVMLLLIALLMKLALPKSSEQPAQQVVGQSAGDGRLSLAVGEPPGAASEGLPLEDAPSYRTTAAQLQADLDANEVSADAKMKGKIVFVSGVVEAIELDFKNDVVVRLRSGRSGLGAMFTLQDTPRERKLAEGLAKGALVEIVCPRIQRIVSVPTGSRCVFKP